MTDGDGVTGAIVADDSPPQWILDTIANRPPNEARRTVLYHLGGSAPVEVRAVFHSSAETGYWAELADGRITFIRRSDYYDLAERLFAPRGEAP